MAWLDRITQLYDAWALQGSVLSSLALHVLLILFAGIRRRKATGVRRAILWLASQPVDSVAKYFLSHLSLSCTSHEQQLLAFWATFLLQHLGRPDNISAYTLEDNKLSTRQVIDLVAQIMGVLYVLWKHIPFGGGGTLLPAAWIMFAVGVAKYVERTLALWWGDLGSIRSLGEKQKPRSFSADPQLWWGNLGSIRSSGEKQKPRSFSADPCGGRELDDERALQVAHRMFHISKGAFADYSAAPKRPDDPCGGRELDDEQALQVAHRMFHISKGAFADYSALKDPLKRPDERQLFSHGWKAMCKVVEMELSLMYDIVYTKAARVHIWCGYLLRFVSPPLTVVAFLLFWFYNKAGQRRVDVIITYILLAATFLLDTKWLLGALGSTWTYAFLNKMASTRWCWLHHQLLCTGRWHRLRHVIVSLDPCRLLGKEPVSYRMWSGTIGQYNLLHECTHDTKSLCRTLAKKVGLDDSWNEFQYHYCGGLDISKKLKELLFDRIWQELEKQVEEEEPAPSAEIGEQILTLHIATDVFLRCNDQNAASSTCVKAIKVLSNYMVFLVAVRPYMLPGLTLSTLHKATRDALKKIRGCSSTTREKELACKLREMQGNNTLYDKSIIISDGALYADVLLQLLKNERWDIKCVLHELEMQEKSKKRLKRLIPGLWDCKCEYVQNEPKLLDDIFHAWVRMLISASIRCSRDSHAKQLSRGGELTTLRQDRVLVTQLCATIA